MIFSALHHLTMHNVWDVKTIILVITFLILRSLASACGDLNHTIGNISSVQGKTEGYHLWMAVLLGFTLYRTSPLFQRQSLAVKTFPLQHWAWSSKDKGIIRQQKVDHPRKANLSRRSGLLFNLFLYLFSLLCCSLDALIFILITPVGIFLGCFAHHRCHTCCWL